ncbi:MAG TPA: uroporphyrinogen decarboxylase family protein, partial [Armatimonadota bacterium]
MTPRERFQCLMRYEPVDALPVVAVENYHEAAAIARWRTEGLPVDQYPTRFLGMGEFVYLPLGLGPLPAFKDTVLSEDAESYVQIDWMGATVRRMKEAPGMYYGYIDHPVKTMADWERYAERFRADTPERLPADLAATVAELNASPNPVGLQFFPWFFRLGFYALGMERFLTAPYEEPELIHAMFSTLGAIAMTTVQAYLDAGVRIDFAAFVEDLAYKNGPHCSPKIYEEFWLPYQDPVVELLRSHGVPLICQWTAGNIDVMFPMLFAHGFNCFFPVERGANMDPIELRAKYGRALRMAGGIPKEAFIEGPAAIDREIARLLPLIREGG